MILIPNPSRLLAVLLAVALSCSVAARADEASHQAKAKELMDILHTQRTVLNISDNLKKQVADAAEKMGAAAPSEIGKVKVAEFEKKANQMIDAQLGWEAMQPNFVDAFAKNFTEEQLDGILAFYKSPAGLSLLQNMPTVNQQLSQFGNSHMAALQPELKQAFEDFRNSIAALAAPPAAAPAEKPAPAVKPTPAPATTHTAPSKPK